jgi:YVTN family beta-propeller protein
MENTVKVVDTASNMVVATVVGVPGAFGVAVNSTGTRVYTANVAPANSVSVIDTSTNTVIATVPVGGDPEGIAVTPDGSKVYVASSESNTVSVINASTNTVITTVGVGSDPIGVAAHPNGTRVYVGNSNSRTLSVIDTTTDTVIATISGAGDVNGVVVHPDGTRVYIADAAGGTIRVLDTATNALIAGIPVGRGPRGVEVAPDGTRVYTANYDSGDVSVIDTATNTEIDVDGDPANGLTRITPASGAFGIAVTQDGACGYVASGVSGLSVINTVTNTIVATVPIEGFSAFGKFIGPERGTANCARGAVTVTIDIKPGEAPNPINPKARGNIPVAILSTSSFNAPARVRMASPTFGRTGNEPSLNRCNSEDVNRDGFLDLICLFDTQAAAFQAGDTQGILKGQTVEGTPIRGTDSVLIVP